MSTALPAAPAATAARVNWYRAVRIAFALSPLIAVHLALFAIPFIEFSWWYILMLLVVTRITGLGIDDRLAPLHVAPLVQDVAVVPVPARARRLHRAAEGAAVVGDPPPPAPPPLRHARRTRTRRSWMGSVYGHMGWLFVTRPHAPRYEGRPRPGEVSGAGLARPAVDDPRFAHGGGVLSRSPGGAGWCTATA